MRGSSQQLEKISDRIDMSYCVYYFLALRGGVVLGGGDAKEARRGSLTI